MNAFGRFVLFFFFFFFLFFFKILQFQRRHTFYTGFDAFYTFASSSGRRDTAFNFS